VDGRREVGIVAHQQHVVAQPRRQRLGVEGPARELGLELRFGVADLLAGEPRGLRRPHLGACQARIELHPDRLQRGAGRARLLATLVGQGALGVGRALGRVSMSQQPDHRDAPP
jgi:hypothetical protein